MKAWFALAASVALVGCASTRQHQLIDAQLERYVFAHPAAEVADRTVALLRDREFKATSGKEAGGFIVRTPYKLTFEGGYDVARTLVRYAVLVEELGPRHCRVRAMRLTRSTMSVESFHPGLGGGSGSRVGPDGSNMGAFTQGAAANLEAARGMGADAMQFGAPVLTRDLSLEWELVRGLDPPRAKQIEAVVDFELEKQKQRGQ